MTLPLDGIRVLDWTQFQHGPVASMMLADLGADVIKIEDPVNGDPGRAVWRASGLYTFKSGRNSYFEYLNRNKRSVTLDLKSNEGKEILMKLVDKSDVFVHNFLPRIVDRLGLDYETLRARNPRLIYSVASGYGPKGPGANTPAFDYSGQARSGLMTMAGEPDMPPLRIEGAIADQTGAVLNAYGVLAAIIARGQTGVGQRVDTSLLGSMMWVQGINVAFKLAGDPIYDRTSRSSSGSPLWNYYKCADGKWIVLACLQADRFWPGVCRALGIEHLQNAPEYADVQARFQNRVELIALFDQIFAEKPRPEWVRLLTENEVIIAEINDFDDLAVDPDARANDYIVKYDHPAWGPIETMGFPTTFSGTPLTMRRPAPEHGEHTEEILTELLGYGWDEIVRLREKKVI